MHCHTHTNWWVFDCIVANDLIFYYPSLPIEAPDREVVKTVLMYTFLNNVSWKNPHIYLVKVDSYCQEYYSNDQELSVIYRGLCLLYVIIRIELKIIFQLVIKI